MVCNPNVICIVYRLASYFLNEVYSFSRTLCLLLRRGNGKSREPHLLQTNEKEILIILLLTKNKFSLWLHLVILELKKFYLECKNGS